MVIQRATVTSQDAKDLASLAEAWLRSNHGLTYLVGVMAGVVRSRRHGLFLERSQRQGCSGSGVSELHRLSNTGYLEAGGLQDTRILRYLETTVFLPHLARAQQELQEVAEDRHTTFLYCSCVLLPETMIYLLEQQGGSRQEAERAFLRVEDDLQERRGLQEEIKEAAKKWQEDQKVEEDWIDHSDISDTEEPEIQPILKIRLRRIGFLWKIIRT